MTFPKTMLTLLAATALSAQAQHFQEMTYSPHCYSHLIWWHSKRRA